jgi:Domain of unknown function (DUF5668)/Putative adhesin
MRFNRGFLFWGLGFVTAGLVALAIQAGYLDKAAMAEAWRLWPLLLVVLGVALILSRTPFALLGTALAAVVIGGGVGSVIAVGPGFASNCGDSPPSALQDHTGTLGASASLNWQLNCGTLDVRMSQGFTWQASVGSTGSHQPGVDAATDHLDVASADQGGGFLVDQGRERWVLELPSATTYDAEIHINASKGTMDLTDAKFSTLSLQPNAADLVINVGGASAQRVDLQVNAGSVSLVANNGTSLSGTIEVNAGSVQLCAPSDAGLRITASGTAFGTNLGDTALTRSGDTWESAAYTQSAHQVTLTVHGNAASFDLNPPGGCL